MSRQFGDSRMPLQLAEPDIAFCVSSIWTAMASSTSRLYSRKGAVSGKHPSLRRGHLCRRPAAYWKFSDTDGDHVADERTPWFNGGTVEKCGNDGTALIGARRLFLLDQGNLSGAELFLGMKAASLEGAPYV